MISFFLFVIFLLVLSFLTSHLKRAIQQLLYSLTKSKTLTLSLFSLLFFPGTLIHELAHFLAASLLLVPVSNLELTPKIAADGKIRLGSVQIAKVDFLRRTIIGLAPLFAGLAVLWLIFSLEQLSNLSLTQLPVYLAKPDPALQDHLLFAIYFVFSLSNTMFSSKKDLEALIVFIPFVLTMLLILYLLGFDFAGVKIEIAGKITEVLLNIISQLNLILLISIIINLTVFILMYLLSKIFRLKTL